MRTTINRLSQRLFLFEKLWIIYISTSLFMIEPLTTICEFCVVRRWWQWQWNRYRLSRLHKTCEYSEHEDKNYLFRAAFEQGPSATRRPYLVHRTDAGRFTVFLVAGIGCHGHSAPRDWTNVEQCVMRSVTTDREGGNELTQKGWEMVFNNYENELWRYDRKRVSELWQCVKYKDL